MHRASFAFGIVAGLSAIGCAPADVAGNYSVNTTTGENRCMVDGWTEGEMSGSPIPVVITQDGDQITATVQGLVGTFLELTVGDNQFDGQVSGNGITAALVGDNTARQGDCVYTWTVDLTATVDGDVIQGTLLYRPVTNGHPDCGALDTCEGNRQSFNGTRPPSGG